MQDRKAPQDSPQQTELTSETWNTLPWRKLEQHVFRIQKRIYRASQGGNTRAVHKLQKLLMKSEAARLLAVRRVTQENQGKKTAGVDGVKSVKPKERLVMASQIHPKHWKHQHSKPVRRVWIPKPGKAEKRPLGIPPMLERGKQALAKMALEPEWEAQFEPNSYGFRPGRSCHDAREAIYNAIKSKPKFVFDADISGCFDHISHEVLVEKLHTYTAMRQIIKAWLKAGVMEGRDFSPTEAGTPQGGVISPLLMNVALHGMEQAIVKGYSKSHAVEKPLLIRYADDFVIVHSNREDLEKAATTITHWLAGMGLTLSPKKTKITHTLTPTDGNVGFDFLGFTVRQFPVGKTHTGRNTHGTPLGFKTLIKPSTAASKRHTAAMKHQIKKFLSASQAHLIKELNPIIWGWSAYYRTTIASRVFHSCDSILWHQVMCWARRRHPNKGRHWVKRRYWHTVEKRHWVFATPEGAELRTHSKTHIQRHIKVKGTASPYDGNLLYWSQRLKTHPMMHATKAKLLHRQQGKCRWCELIFRDGDLMEIDHIQPRSQGGTDRIDNTWLLHLHCHDERHANLAETEKLRKQLADAGINIQ